MKIKINKDLIQRILFTLMAIFVYRIACHIILPGINLPVVVEHLFSDKAKVSSGIFFSILNELAGSLSYMSVAYLSVVPVLSAQMFFQMLSSSIGFDYFKNLKKQGAAGRAKIAQYTHWISFAISFSQSLFTCVSVITQASSIPNAFHLSKWFFLGVGVPTLMCGSMFLIWLGSQISKKGIGSGHSVIMYAGIVSGLPHGIKRLYQGFQGSSLSFSGQKIGIFIAIVFIVGLLIIFVENVHRKVLIQYNENYRGFTPYSERLKQTLGVTRNTHILPLKINLAGIMPPIISGFMMGSFGYIWKGVKFLWDNLPLLQPTTKQLLVLYPILAKITNFIVLFFQEKMLYFVWYGFLLVLCTFVYTPVLFDPKDIAENLKKSHACVQGVAPGYRTAEYFMMILENLMYFSAIYIVIVCVSIGRPEGLLTYLLDLPFILSGTSLLIACSTPIEIVSSIRSYIERDYEKILKESHVDF